MAWFKRSKPGFLSHPKKDMPNGLWVKCEGCGEVVYKKQLAQNSYVCTRCNFHFRVRGSDYIQLLLDSNSYKEIDTKMQPMDFLNFRDTKKYSDRLREARKKTGLNDAIRTGYGLISGIPVVFGVMDFSFIGGSMGSVVGEKVARATKVAIDKKLPLIVVSASGGARMMEGAMSLMQMAKTSAYLAKLSDTGLPFISIVTNPTTGGVSASYAMLGDVIIAEPGALIGFAGPRVIKQTIGQDLPEGFQTSEFMLKHGFIDAILTRKEMKEKLVMMLKFFGSVTGKNNEQTKTDNYFKFFR